MINYYVRKVLDNDQVSLIQDLLKHSEEHNLWIDGLNSGGGSVSTKSNKELADIQMLSTINSCIMESLDRDRKFLAFTSASTTNLNIISKTESGNYYNPHFDNWCNGDYSTTVFLNNPDTYDGGELCLLLGNEQEKEFKLDAGWAITYPTGIIHRVNKVLSGTRYVSVFWTTSKIRDPFMRSINYQVELLIDILEKQFNSIHPTDCQSVLKDPLFIAMNLKNEIFRHYGD